MTLCCGVLRLTREDTSRANNDPTHASDTTDAERMTGSATVRSSSSNSSSTGVVKDTGWAWMTVVGM